MACHVCGKCRSGGVRGKGGEVMKLEASICAVTRIGRGDWRLAPPSIDNGGGARGFVGVAVPCGGNGSWVNGS